MKIVTRQEAKKEGLSRYFTGEPCKHGHVAERYSGAGICVECDRARRVAARACNEDLVEVKLGKHRALQVWTLYGMVALTSGKMVERAATGAKEFVREATVMLPSKALLEVSAALKRFARQQIKVNDSQA
jgi:hypothetical protein